MIRINQVNLPLEYSGEDLLRKCADLLRIHPEKIRKLELVRQSVDARKKPHIVYSCTVDVTLDDERRILKNSRCRQAELVKRERYRFPKPGEEELKDPVVIVGMGPAGLFAGYLLAKAGYRPVLLERGQAVELRRAAVEEFWEKGVLNPMSNVQFGEGGAGTFSDGKLNTTIRDQGGRNRKVLEIFVENGAPREILYEAKPHIGTDILFHVVKNMRQRILAWGGQVRFESRVTDFLTQNGSIAGVEINGTERLACSACILAVGHSARDTFSLLFQKKISMEPKPFAVGFRVIHPQRLINENQYGVEKHEILGAAPYKLTARTLAGRGVYTFCMCPGGFVVNASSQSGHTVVNGMSYHDRAGRFANSAVIVTVGERDFDGRDALSGMRFQQELERRAYELGKGAVPVERYGDFHETVTGERKEDPEDSGTSPWAAEKRVEKPEDSGTSPWMVTGERKENPAEEESSPEFWKECIKGKAAAADLTGILPPELNAAFVEGMEHFDSLLPGFGNENTLLCGVESRTSSPVRIVRKDTLESESVAGLYPCGEGAGYAGGIVSAAVDGMRAAEAIAVRYSPYSAL
ncbi:MAG: FAD-dependent monooxygenase [Lachnospiraceae bacterium]|nr:FAD-dependent monooxygenase [Lachnospiraceae bacterium]